MRTDDILSRMHELDSGRPSPETAPLARVLELLRRFSPADREACPSREDLVAFAEAGLSSADAALLARHIDACPFCNAELADWEALSAPTRLELAVRLLRDGLELVRHSFARVAQPQPLLVRGEQPPGLLMTSPCDELDLELRLQPLTAQSADLRVALRGPVAGRRRVNLRRGRDLLESRVASVGDELTFAAVAAGDYAIDVAPRGCAVSTTVALSIEAGES